MIDNNVVCGLIRAALNGRVFTLPSDFAMEEYLTFGKRQQIEALLITGALKCGWKMTTEIRNMYISHVVASEQQLQLMKKMFAAFEQHKIDFMPLKGAIMKALYPSAEMRTMGDIDVLIRVEQYPKIRSLMQLLGMVEHKESNHEHIWTKGHFVVELHKLLIPSYNKDYYAYYGDGWRLALPIAGTTRYEMTPEDCFVYLFTHYAKHYRDTGAGIRQVLDLHVFRMAYPMMNERYICQQLKILQLDRFYQNTIQVIAVWINQEMHTEASDIIANRLFSDTVFGTPESGQVSDMLKRSKSEGSVAKARKTRWIQAFFPTMEVMRMQYPILNRHKWLLPLMWVVRGFRTLVYRSERLKQFNENMQLSKEDDVAKYQEMLTKSGLDFNFK